MNEYVDNEARKARLVGKTVTMAHGAGGRQTSELIDMIFKAHFDNPDLTADDAAVLAPPAGKMAVSTDGFIVSPAFYPGGNIGKLSICGTVNDLSCMGAKPLYLTSAFVIEEGFPMEKLEEIAKKRQDKTTAKLLAQKEREERRLAARKLKAESKLRARQARAARKGKVIPVDSTALREIDSLIARNDREMDSLLLQMADSLAADSLAMRIPADSVDSLTDSADSVYRLMKGFRNVRIFRSDFQAVCDSMTAISTDSTIHLYINPVLWNQGNQITSDVMDIFTENQQITRAEFIGTPMMVSQLDTVHYNQVAGKQMTAWFRDNQIYRNDVNGNAQTIYYMQDGEPPQITGMGVIESGDCSFYIEDKQVVTIVYRKDPDWNICPMDKIPADQELYLKGFKWAGARRPTQGVVFDRRVRPSQREEKRHLAHPDFPLLKALEERKKQLIEERRWADRNDQVDAATVEWMRALGFEVGQPRESGPKL